MNSVLLHRSLRSNALLGFSKSGGKGGQNVNKVNTKVTLCLRLSLLDGLSEAELARVRKLLAGRISEKDEILVTSDEERSQLINRERAFARLEAMISSAAKLPKRRIKTTPGPAAREKRLHSKKIHSRKKAERRTGPEY